MVTHACTVVHPMLTFRLLGIGMCTVLHPMLTFQLKVSGDWHVLQYCAASHANLSTEGFWVLACVLCCIPC